VAEAYTAIPGRYVPLAETVRGFKEIVEGRHDEVPEQAFFMVGTIGEALEAAGRLKAPAVEGRPEARTAEGR
jgi:F-type H+-transporting ATPase subunit beta